MFWNVAHAVVGTWCLQRRCVEYAPAGNEEEDRDRAFKRGAGGPKGVLIWTLCTLAGSRWIIHARELC